MPNRKAPSDARNTLKNGKSSGRGLTPQNESRGAELRLHYTDLQARRAHGEKVFTMCVLAGVIATGLCFMAAGIQGGKELVIGGVSYFAGHSWRSRR
jgi:hypothetical protein